MLSKANYTSFSGKKIVFLFLLQSLIFNLQFSHGQGGTWTWVSGSNQAFDTGVFGTQGVPSVNNHPPGIYEACEWKDKQGNFWIYGGSIPDMGDMWKFDPVTKEWTWVKGNGQTIPPPSYGIQGVPDPSNIPGNRSYAAATWVDTSGALWLFGGINNYYYSKNDLWKYDIGTNVWTWISGNTTLDPNGVYGTQGIPSPFNIPGSRNETSSAWTDASNNLWLFGGTGYANIGDTTYGLLNDLWKYDISAKEWTWMKGSDSINASPSYGVKGVPAISNDPGSRFTYTKWKDLNGNFWIMGGGGGPVSLLGPDSLYNDLWKYDLNSNEWTWMSGPDFANDTGNYQTYCSFDSLSHPYSRDENRASVTDNQGRFWMFGGFIPGTELGDLWVFDPQQLKWNLLSGTNVMNQAGNYGTLGVASSSNIPPSRGGANAWWGNDNKFYVFGGQDYNFIVALTYCDVWVFNPDTNCLSAAVLPPVANFEASKTTICANDCINFTDLSTNATSWQWHFAGAADSTSTAQNPQNVCYEKAGIYNVTLIASNTGGSNTATFSNYINVNPAPTAPLVTQHNDTLYCATNPAYTGYQWYMDTNAIAGATDTFLVVSKSGDYSVKVSNENGCKIATGINVTIGIQNYVSDNIISLYPNPATDELLISGNWKSETGSMRLTIYNVLGQIIYNEEFNEKQKIINCKPLPASIYFVQVANETGRWVGKFVKE